MDKINMSWRNYFRPTPKNLKRTADAVLASATLASTFTFLMDYKTAAIWIMGLSVVAKLLSNFFSNDSETPQNPEV